MITNHDQIIVIAMIMGAVFGFPFAYWKGKEIGRIEGRIAYAKLERAKREGN